MLDHSHATNPRPLTAESYTAILESVKGWLARQARLEHPPVVAGADAAKINLGSRPDRSVGPQRAWSRSSMPNDQFASYPSLKGMPVIISGGASGIGEGIVRAFPAQESKVGFIDIVAEQGQRLEAELRATGHAVRFAHCDITDVGSYKAAIAKLEEEDGPTLALVNNAADDRRYPYDKITPEVWEWSIGVNLRHSFFAAQATAPGMIAAGRGSIINFGSIAWMIMLPELAPYSASKAAMHGMSRSLAKEFGPHGIRVNTVVPGWIMTEKQLSQWVGPKELELIAGQQAMKGLLRPPDVARMVLFLAADDSRMISGQVFMVDGGWAHG